MASTSESILLHGTWSDYRQHAAVSLDADQETYLKALTVVGLCSNRKTVSYREIQAAVDVATVKELEHLLIHHCALLFWTSSPWRVMCDVTSSV